jgi:nitroreductase
MTEQTLRDSLQQAFNWRYATKRFDSTKKIPVSDWKLLERSLQMAPSSFGLQPWHFVVITNAELRAKLQPHSWNQPQITEASHLVVLAARTSVDTLYIDSFLNQLCAERGVATENLSAYRQIMIDFTASLTKANSIESWTTHQTYVALGSLLSTAALLKIDACPLEGIDPNQYNTLLNLPAQGYSAKVACALGYRSASDAAASNRKIRFPTSQIFSHID